MSENCKTCDKPKATPSQWSGPEAHEDGCECAECESLCWDSNCEPYDWRGEALRLRRIPPPAALAEVRSALEDCIKDVCSTEKARRALAGLLGEAQHG